MIARIICPPTPALAAHAPPARQPAVASPGASRSLVAFAFRSLLGRRCASVLAIALSLSGCGALPWQSQEESKAQSPAPPAMTAQEKTAATLEQKVIAAANQVENNIYFSLGGVTVSSRERAKLQQHAAYLKENPETSVTLIGFTDDLGSRNYNVAIAEQRVAAVRKLLRAYRVPGGQIRRYSVGSEKTPKTCKTEECRRKMRRVELRYAE
ncbi:OmpA family protein [Accumulibacter sp.]|uniref:OmpA family protein n=1 Tax=Accumulibacter sp. TaxID=2053492 RepID=UPI001ACC69EE|nr:OmpA family protein [Accumulibacter sp.]MBN8514862.1 OmpA family protein [Accumulibacter sp.]MBO3703951.1 OmpA family protein [Accumulibacter sp.]